ncbi:MAG: Fur family transcriptional regulator [Lactobacillus sp.]
MDYIAKATEVLHQFKLKATRPRVAILAYLMTHHNHPTVEVIAQQLHGDGKKLATIYNTLQLLEQHGVVIELRNGDHSTHYDYFSHPHFHIICAKCGKIADVEYPNADRVETQMLAEAKKQTGYISQWSHVEIYGLCPVCQRKQVAHDTAKKLE